MILIAMPSFSDSIFLFVLALLLFGPKKLPVLARELGKWVGEFRRASNEFKMQMEDELRQAEQEDRQKQIAAMEAAAPVAKPAEEPAQAELPGAAAEVAARSETAGAERAETMEARPEPLPIAVSGELKIMPPATGLPIARGANEHQVGHGAGDALGGLLDAIPSDDAEHAGAVMAGEGESSGR